MATGMRETLHRSPRNAESFRVKWRAFRLVPPYGGLLVTRIIDHNSFGVIYTTFIFRFALYPPMMGILKSRQEGTDRLQEKLLGLLLEQL